MNTSNDSSNSSYFGQPEETITNLSNIFNILSSCGLVLSLILFDVPCFIVIYKSKFKLQFVEFYMLLTINGSISLAKITCLISPLNGIFHTGPRGLLPCFIYYAVIFYLFAIYHSILIYYSILHLTTQRPVSYCRLNHFFELIQSLRTFTVYCVSVSLTFLAFLAFYLTTFDNIGVNMIRNFCSTRMPVMKSLVPVIFVLLSVLAIVFYLIAALNLTCYRRRRQLQQQRDARVGGSRQIRSSSTIRCQHQQIQLQISQHCSNNYYVYKSNLLSVFKFLCLACYACLLALCQFGLFGAEYFSFITRPMLVAKISESLFNFFLFFHPIVVIYIHNILRHQFKDNFC